MNRSSRILAIISNAILLVTTTLASIKFPSAQQLEDSNDKDEAVYHHAIAQSTSDLSYDENNRLASHTLVYPSGKCADYIQKQRFTRTYGVELVAVENDAMRDFFPSFDTSPLANDEVTASLSDCPAICLERGVDKSLITFPAKNRRFDPSNGEDYDYYNFEEWFVEECTRVEICFINYYYRYAPLDVYWINHEGELVHNVAVDYGDDGMECFESSLGHTFDIIDRESNKTVDTITVEFYATIPTGRDPPHDTLDTKRVLCNVKDSLYDEWNRHLDVERTFTPLGFKKGRLPPDLFSSMGAFYHNNRHHVVREEWGDKGHFVNWWESQIKFISIPWHLKHGWQTALLQLVEEWVGVALEQTSMYGMRRYETGSRLLTHVDRETTHATSLIVNIAQGGLSEAWPVEVHDHAGRLHQIAMEAGDVVYYESAACLHGRNTPLRGEGAYYVNLFTHYRPTGDPMWFRKENPEGAIERLMDVGECRVMEGMEGMVGVGAVSCDEEAVGPYLSPDLLTARSGEDLFQWWLKKGSQEIRDYVSSVGMGYCEEEDSEDDDSGDEDIEDDDDDDSGDEDIEDDDDDDSVDRDIEARGSEDNDSEERDSGDMLEISQEELDDDDDDDDDDHMMDVYIDEDESEL